MPRPQLPPTPLNSTDIIGKDKVQNCDMESVFSLPPPALQSGSVTPSSKAHRRGVQPAQLSPPLSPEDKHIGSTSRRKRTLSGSDKVKPTTDVALPPPPSRARKIIQMKPKQTASTTSDEHSDSSSKRTPSREKSTTVQSQAMKRKQAQPSTTSAAGRRIARKTAHSIIERRRRSKMNEEFGVLKDLIPACAGTEMHKLAILQAGIEYLRYLESCIEKLKAQNENGDLNKPTPFQYKTDQGDDEEEMDIDDGGKDHESQLAPQWTAVSESDVSSPRITMKLPSLQYQQPLPSFRKSSAATSVTNSGHASPNLQPVRSASSISVRPGHTASTFQTMTTVSTSQKDGSHSISPTPILAPTPAQSGVSPTFGAFQFSPDLSRTSTWPSVNGRPPSNKSSPSLLPLPYSVMSSLLPVPALTSMKSSSYQSRGGPDGSEGQAEATATAALMMMTTDRRGSGDLTKTISGKAMSVKDLLSS